MNKFINEEEYQIIKNKMHKNDDYFSERELKKFYKLR